LAEWIAFAAPIEIFGQKIFGSWLLDFLFAYLFGVAFQYFTIKPMKDLPPGKGLWAAIKADTLSLTAWQVLGMYGCHLRVPDFRSRNSKDESGVLVHDANCHACRFRYQLSSQWWLIRKGVKEAM